MQYVAYITDVIAHALYLKLTSSNQSIRKLRPDLGIEHEYAFFSNALSQQFIDRFRRQDPYDLYRFQNTPSGNYGSPLTALRSSTPENKLSYVAA